MNYLSNFGKKGRNVNSFLAFLLFVCLSVMPAMAQQDKDVTLDVKNESVENVLKMLNQQTGLKFFYDQNVVAQAPRVTLQVEKTSLQSVLNQISSQTGLIFNRENNTITVGKRQNQKTEGTNSSQQIISISGRVVDASGEPVIGANVLVKGTTNGVITDIDGNYTLNNVPADALVTISYIGYQPLELKAVSRNLANVVLKEDAEMLDEVVVVGYGVQRKRDVTTSISSMKASELAVPVSSVDQAIVGKMTGVQVTQPNGIPGGGFTIKVRGSGSITAGTDPLYVVDGFPMSSEAGSGTGQNVSPLSTINMNDIESIEFGSGHLWFARC